MLAPSQRVAGFHPSIIREMTRLAMQHNAMNLAQGFPDFQPPQHFLAALAEASAAGAHQYTITWGSLNLRTALAEKVGKAYGWTIDPDVEVTVTCGVTEGTVAALHAVLGPGDEVVILEPAHENYYPATILAGAVPRYVALRPPHFQLDTDALRKACNQRTRAIVINTPHNPSGRVFTQTEIQALCDVCLERNLILITDEIYEHLVYDGRQHIAPATLPGMRERTIVVSGLGKTFSITGWRLGYVVAPAALSDGVRKVHDFSTICAATPLQEAAAIGLRNTPPAYYEQLRQTYQQRRDKFVTALNKAGLPTLLPEGAYYAMADISSLGFPDAMTAVQWLMREVGVAAVPGLSFYQSEPELGRQLWRFAFCKQDATLEEAERRLGKLAQRRNAP